jgi:3-methyladenine DNA glycosylase Mpg
MKNLQRRLIGPNFFCDDAVNVAKALIGVTLLVNGTGGIIIETEAYDETDPGRARSQSFCRGIARQGEMRQRTSVGANRSRQDVRLATEPRNA